MEVTVVAEDVPLLTPISLLKVLGAVINIPESTIQFRRAQADTVMHSLSSGHLAISIMEFGPKGWQFPEACKAVRQERDFRTNSQLVPAPKRSGPSLTRSQTPLSLFGHACVPSASCGAAPGDRSCSPAKTSRTTRQSRTQSLAHRVGQALLYCVLQWVNCVPIKPAEECLHEAHFLKERAHELGALQPVPKPLETLAESGFDRHWKGFGGDGPDLSLSIGQSQGQASAGPAPATSGSMDTAKEEKYHAVIADQKKDLDQLRAQLELLQGPGPEIDLAEDACVSLEMVLDSMDEGLKRGSSGGCSVWKERVAI